MTSTAADQPASPLATVAAWLEYSGYALRRVYGGHYVFRHVERGTLATAPAEPRSETVVRLMAEVEGFPAAASTGVSVSPEVDVSEADLLSAASALAGGSYDRAVTPLEGGGFLVEVAQFAAVLGQGDTVEHAHQSAQLALVAAIAVLLEDGAPVPTPLAPRSPSSDLGRSRRVAAIPPSAPAWAAPCAASGASFPPPARAPWRGLAPRRR